MQTPALTALQSRDASFTSQSSNRSFFVTHPVVEVARSLFFSSILWMLLAIALYAVYTMVVSH